MGSCLACHIFKIEVVLTFRPSHAHMATLKRVRKTIDSTISGGFRGLTRLGMKVSKMVASPVSNTAAGGTTLTRLVAFTCGLSAVTPGCQHTGHLNRGGSSKESEKRRPGVVKAEICMVVQPSERPW